MPSPRSRSDEITRRPGRLRGVGRNLGQRLFRRLRGRGGGGDRSVREILRQGRRRRPAFA